MKKRSLLFILIAGMCYLGLSSNINGPAAVSGSNCTGTNGSASNCGGGGCHGGASTSTTAIITVVNTSGPATSYVPGATYTVTATGVNSAMTHYGFQLTSVSGSSPSQANAGTFSGFPSQVGLHSTGGLNFVEHTSTIFGSSATFSKSFVWTAPTAAVGSVTMYLTVNAVNGDGNAGAADVSGHTSITLTRNTTAVTNVSKTTSIAAYPNPATNMLNISMDEIQSGNYTIHIYDLSGKLMNSRNINVSSAAQVNGIDVSNLAPGMYQLIAENEGNTQHIAFVKQ